jgi:hypothetical protein
MVWEVILAEHQITQQFLPSRIYCRMQIIFYSRLVEWFATLDRTWAVLRNVRRIDSEAKYNELKSKFNLVV